MYVPKSAERRIAELTLREEVGARLRLTREGLGVERKQWVARYGVKWNSLSQWEQGQFMPDLIFLKSLCEDYNLSLDWFLRGVPAGRPRASTAAPRPAFEATPKAGLVCELCAELLLNP